VHGEASVARFEIRRFDQHVEMHATLPSAQLRVERRIVLDERTVRVREVVENLTATDRPAGWTQHATIGPPFLQHGVTTLHVPADRSLVYPGPFGPADYLAAGEAFVWPHAPRHGGGSIDLSTYSSSASSSSYTAHRLDPREEEAAVIAFTPALGLAFGYAWRRGDFPWLGLWEENRARTTAPWNGGTVTWGLEFGVSPLPESRRQMIERGRTFGTPGYRWIPAHQRVEVEFRARLWPAAALPSAIE